MKCFCSNCNKEVAYKWGFVFEKNIKVNDIELNYDKIISYCLECGEYIPIPEIEKINENTRDKTYEKIKNGIPISDSYEERFEEILNEVPVL